MESEIIDGIIFSQFNEKLGPVAIAWIPPKLSNKTTDYISLKSFNLLTGEEGSIPKSLAIIPFPSQNLEGLIKSLEIEDKTRRGGVIDSSIIVLFTKANALNFYRNINLFEDLFNKAATTIIKLAESKATKEQIEEELKKFYTKITDTYTKSLTEKPIKKELKKSLLLLFNLIHKNLDRTANALIFGEPVVVIGDQALVELVIDTLTIFCIERTPEIVYWTEEYTSGDIIGGPSYLSDIYETDVILDLKNGKVIGGKANKYCKNILKHARRLDSSHAEHTMRKKLQKFYSATNELLDMVRQKKVIPARIDSFIKDLELDELEFIETYTTIKHPDIAEELTEAISVCRNKMSKILSGFEKQKW